MKRKALGKGLDALLPSRPSRGSQGLLRLNIAEIRPNPLQPRLEFSQESLAQLAQSIRENGIIQPLIVRKQDDHYELVAGERRWRAAQKAQIQEVPVIVQQFGDQKMLELALVENLQREDLTAIEEARAFQLLQEQFSLSQTEIARRLGKSRVAVTNTLRLLGLPKAIQEMILKGRLSMGHARALLGLPAAPLQLAMAQEIMEKGLSVRDVEKQVKRLQKKPAKSSLPAHVDPNLRKAIQRLEERSQTRVEIQQKGAKGRIILHFSSPEELERLYEWLIDN